jgi:RNA polymerase sigma-70 factor, ECF subfamily
MDTAMSSGAVPQPDGALMPQAVSRDSGPRAGRPKWDTFDSDYVQRLKEGHTETERHFVTYFGELLLIKLRARLRRAQLVEDLRQETFLRVLTALKTKNTLQSPESLGAFVNMVCNNLLCEQFRRDAKRRTVEVDDRFDAVDDSVSVESALVTEERRQQVRQVLDELPEKDRDLLRMVFFEEIDRDEICRSFQVEREYLRVLVHRAKTRFRECLRKRRIDGELAGDRI